LPVELFPKPMILPPVVVVVLTQNSTEKVWGPVMRVADVPGTVPVPPKVDAFDVSFRCGPSAPRATEESSVTSSAPAQS
jgi:hypothetical protein